MFQKETRKQKFSPLEVILILLGVMPVDIISIITDYFLNRSDSMTLSSIASSHLHVDVWKSPDYLGNPLLKDGKIL